MQQAIDQKMIGVGCVDITARERELVNRVLDSGLITTGPVTDEFERKFAERHDQKSGLLLNSGTSALHVAIAALKEKYGWEDGSEVIVPALTFIASANVIIQNGLKPVFVDSDAMTYNLDPIEVEAAITSNTRAILAVHLFGLPANMTAIMQIARKRRLAVIEDSCEAMGVTHAGKPVGSFGHVACFSLYAAHLITAGVGGVAISSDDELMALMRSYANHGRDPEFLGFRNSQILDPGRYLQPGNLEKTIGQRFKFDRLGFSYRATQMEAALALAQLERLDDILAARKRNAEALSERLRQELDLRLPYTPEGNQHAFMMYPIVIDKYSPLDRTQLCHYLETAAIETRPFFNILNQRPYIEMFGPLEANFPIAEWLSSDGFYIGCHQQIDHHDTFYMGEAIKAGIKSLRRMAE